MYILSSVCTPGANALTFFSVLMTKSCVCVYGSLLISHFSCWGVRAVRPGILSVSLTSSQDALRFPLPPWIADLVCSQRGAGGPAGSKGGGWVDSWVDG